MYKGMAHRITWGIFLSALLFSIGGLWANLYQRLWWFDEAVHFYSFFAMTLLVATLLDGLTLTGHRKHPILLLFTIVCLGLALGVLWEIAEWLYDLIRAGDVIKAKRDTMIDLVLDAIGALAAGILVLIIKKDEQDSGRRLRTTEAVHR